MNQESDYDDDEVQEIKRAMREAKVRKRSIANQIKKKWDHDCNERAERDDFMRKLHEEIDHLKKKLSDTEFEMREAKYELSQANLRFNQFKEEKLHSESAYQNQIRELSLQIENEKRNSFEIKRFVNKEIEKIQKLLENIQSTDSLSNKESISRTKIHMMEKAFECIKLVKKVSIINEEQSYEDTKILLKKHELNVESTVDASMLEMCKSLEEENISLNERVKILKGQLAEAKKEAAASQLIPHYRLAIVRSRTYAANLLEQIKREQETSQTLRQQLEETYLDLKKVVDEKRKLYKKLSKATLQEEETEYIEFIENNKANQRKRQNNMERVVQALSEEIINDDYSEDKQKNSKSFDINENDLRQEIDNLDGHIAMLKDKLSKAAILQSQKIISDVIDNSLQHISLHH